MKNNPYNGRSVATMPYMILTIIFVACLIVANMTEIKTVDLGWFTITAGVIVFPISYIINDCVVEVYGFERARFMIWIGFFVSLGVALFLQLAIILPGGHQWQHQEAMVAIYGAVPRIMAASFIAFLSGSMVNAYIMSRMKIARGGVSDSKSFGLRAIVSTILGEGVDSAIFFPIAFAGELSISTILSLIITQTVLKTAYEVAILPVTIFIVKRLRKIEGDANTDTPSDYRWWKITKI